RRRGGCSRADDRGRGKQLRKPRLFDHLTIMTSRSPFDAVVAGRRVFGVTCLFETEAERDQWLRGAHLDEVPELDRRAPPEAPGEAGESSQRGRPSFERTIAAAARAIGPKLDELETLRDQAREV